jgi:catechol 2,3-dioxygenase-like lactoylglutathione lyase family enzyme
MNRNKKFLILVLTVLFASFASAQTNFNFKKDHDALLVKDLGRAANFYNDILGLKEIPNGGLGDHIKWFQLKDGVQVHLIESQDNISMHKGVHMAININKLADFIEFLKSRDVPFENWPGEKGTTNSRPDNVKQIYLQDPDGYWIEINDGKI